MLAQFFQSEYLKEKNAKVISKSCLKYEGYPENSTVNKDQIIHAQKPHLTLYLIETPFNTFANRVDPDQSALVRTA